MKLISDHAGYNMQLVLELRGNSQEAKAARVAMNLILNTGKVENMPGPAVDYYREVLELISSEAEVTELTELLNKDDTGQG